jgi:hypothetical protein
MIRFCGLRVKAAVVAPVVVCFLLVSGCSASLSQIRENEPYRIVNSTKAPQDLAKCIELEIRQSDIGSFFVVALEERPDRNYRITLTQAGWSAWADILVQPSDSGAKVEFRRKGWFYFQSAVLEIIDQCAK